MAAFKSLLCSSYPLYLLYFINETYTTFVFILIYSVWFKVTVKTSYKQTTEALGIDQF